MRVLWIVLLASMPVWGQEAGFQAGFGKAHITPILTDTWIDHDLNARYEPDKGDTYEDRNGNGTFDAVWMAGFHQGRPAQTVHDSLYAIATVLDHGSTRLAIVALDAIGFFHNDVEDIRKRLPSTWAIDHLVLTSTHNHEVPDLIGLWGPSRLESGVDPAYMQFVKNQTLAAIEAAVHDLRRAELRLHEIDLPDDELLGDTRRPEVLDPGIRVMQFVDPATDATQGSILTWANHPETLWSRNLDITADFVGYFRDGVSAGLRYGDEFVQPGVGGIHLYINGAIGGLMTTHPGLSIYDPHLDQTFTEPSHDKARAQGYRLARYVLDRLDTPDQTDAEPAIRVFEEQIRVPLHNANFTAAAQMGLLDRPVNPDTTFTSEVNLITLGDAWIAAIPGEIYPELVNGGIETPPGADFDVEPKEVPPIRALMQGRFNFIFGLANDEIGYIIPLSEWDETEPYLYNADSSPYGEVNSPGPETAGVVHTALKRLVEQAMQN